MKNSFMQFFLLLIFLCAFASLTLAQEKPQAIVFAQIGATEKEFPTETLKRFISQLEREPETTRGFIDVPENTELGKKIKLFITGNSTLGNRISFWGILIRPKNYHIPWDIDIYLIPQGAEISYRCILELCLCPMLTIDAPKEKFNRSRFSTFTAKVEGGEKDDVITYNWKISAGKIIEGQGTPVIKVNAKGAQVITATVEVSGFCEECPRYASFTTKIQ